MEEALATEAQRAQKDIEVAQEMQNETDNENGQIEKKAEKSAEMREKWRIEKEWDREVEEEEEHWGVGDKKKTNTQNGAQKNGQQSKKE